MADISGEMGVLLTLYLLTDGDVDDSISNHQLRATANQPEADVDRAVEALIAQGLAGTVSVSEGVTWLAITASGARVVTEMSNPNDH